jgi:tetratricopeptide (TPR) repeat protein
MSSSATGTTTELDRKTLKRPDDFVVALREFFAGLFKHTRAILVVLGALFAAGLAFAVIANQREERAEAGRNALYKARATLEKELKDLAVALAPPTPAPASEKKGKDADKKPDPTPPPPGPETVAFRKFDVDAKLAGGLKGLQAVTAEFGDTRAGFEAKLMLGDLYYDHGHPAKAVQWYQAASEAARAGLEKAMALSSLGYALEGSGKAAEAAATFEKALDLGEAGLKGDLLLSVARAHELAKEPAKAKAAYDRILSQLPNTDHAKTAESLKAQLE